MAETEADFLKFYDDEDYLLNEVGPRFRATGILACPDFWTLLIWKAERAKTKHKKRLAQIAGSFLEAVQQIASGLFACSDHKFQLELLINTWKFELPTASAILTILYPDDCTVFDWRVCDELGLAYEPWCSRWFSEELWAYYEKFKQTLIENTPAHLSLRDKDRFLIGRSTRKSIESECRT